MTFKDMLDDEREEGRAEGRVEGMAEGSDSKNKELAKRYRDRGVAIEIIAGESGLTVEEIKAL
jgi:predicted transposase YdaD